MAENKTKVQPGRLLAVSNEVYVYELAPVVVPWGEPESLTQVTAAFSYAGAAVRVVRPTYDGEQVEVKQVVLAPECMETLIASYRAYRRASKKAVEAVEAVPADDFDPFLDSDDMP